MFQLIIVVSKLKLCITTSFHLFTTSSFLFLLAQPNCMVRNLSAMLRLMQQYPVLNIPYATSFWRARQTYLAVYKCAQMCYLVKRLFRHVYFANSDSLITNIELINIPLIFNKR